MEIPVVLDYGLIIAITIALVNRIKAEAPAIKGLWTTLLSIAIGAGMYAVALYAPDVVKGFIYIGLASAGIFDFYAKKGTDVAIVAVEKIAENK